MSDQPKLDIEGFVIELIELVDTREEYTGCDIDGSYFQDMLIKYGIALERPATEADCEKGWACELGYQPGDPILLYTDEFKAFRDRIKNKTL